MLLNLSDEVGTALFLNVNRNKGKSVEDIERYWEEKSKNKDEDNVVPYETERT